MKINYELRKSITNYENQLRITKINYELRIKNYELKNELP